jgi:fibronectin-binding autotransporter adhesin
MKQFPSLLRCRLSRKQLVRLLTPVLAFAPIVNAADVFKANNVDALNLVTSWTSGALPTATDVAVFDSTVTDIPEDGTTGFRLMSFPVAASWQGIRVVGAVDKLSIDSFGLGLPALTIGSAGIDLSSALTGTTFDLFGQTLTLGAPQTWRVADGATLSIGGGSLARAAGANLEIVVGTGAIKFESGNLGTYATLNYTHYAGVDAVTKLVVPATYADYASGGNLAGTYTGILNVTGTTTGATQAWRQSNSFTVSSGVRFGQNNTQNTRWTVDTSSGGRVITTPSILVGSAVTQNIEFNGSGGVRAAASASELLIQNFGSGTVIFNTIINNPTSGSHALTKIGPGGLTIASNSGYSGATRINEGVFQIGNGGATGDIGDASAVTVNTSLVFNRTGVLAFPNTITGSGSLSLAGSGEIQLTGANSFAGPVGLGGGTLTFSNTGNLGAGTALNFTGGALRWAAGNTTDISATHTLAFGLGGAGIDTNGQNLTFSSTIGAGGVGGLTKLGSGTLTLEGASTFQGANTISAGVLALANSTGSALGSGDIAVAAGASLTGSGAAGGTATLGNNATLVPGLNGVGTLTVGGLTLNSGSVVNLEFDGGANDRVVTTKTDGLTLNGGGFNLYVAGGTTPLSTAGTYNIVQYSGGIQGTGPGALSVLNPQPGLSYTFGSNAGFLTLQVILDAILTQWSATGAGSWSSSGNWSNGVAASGYIARFVTPLAAPATVTLDGDRTASGLVFSGAQPYTVASGSSGGLTLSKSSGNVLASVLDGDHVISAPVLLASSLDASTETGSSLTLSGVVSGAGGVNKVGGGLLSLTGANTFSGPVSVTAGTLAFGLPGSIGSGSLTLNGGGLRYLSGNTADISSRAITFGLNGATVDTNGNDVIWMNPIGNSGVGAFTKTGAGILALDGVNTYSGGTTVTGGTLRINADAALGTAGTALTLNGGKLSAGTISLTTNSTARPISVGANGGSLAVDAGAVFTLPGVLSGTGVLTKEGSGSLDLVNNAATLSGGVSLNGGTTTLNLVEGYTAVSGTIVGVTSSQVLGTGTITFNGGTFTSTVIDENQFTVNNAMNVPAGQTGTLVLANRAPVSGAVSGAGTLNVSVKSSVARTDFTNSFTGFTGTLNLLNGTENGTTGTVVRLMCNNTPAFNAASFAGAVVNLAPGVSFSTRTNSGGNTIQIGELHGGAGASLTNEAGGAATYQIGALGTDSDYAGNIISGNNPATPIIKVGAGTLTLSGANTSTGTYTVNAGTLLVNGNSATTTGATVALGASLGGTGTIGGTVTVNGTLRPDATGTRGGRLTFGGAVTLASATQFDFAANKFTGVSVDAAGSIAYGGALKLNFLDTVYNGSYTLFQVAGASSGTFTGSVSVVASGTETPLTDSGSGVWTATVGAVSYTFTSSTGVLDVAGATTVVLPSVPAGVGASAGNAQVSLAWSASSNATGYLVKRATTSGSDYTTVASAVTATSYVDTGLTNDTTYYYVIEAVNALGTSGNSSEVSATPTAVVYTALQNWRFEQFGVYNDDGTVLAGDSEDFDGDGLVNILEYALDTNPKITNASPVVVGRSGNFLTLSYPRKATADVALSYTVEGTTALGTTAFATGTGATNTVGTTSTYTDDVNLTTNPRRFLRLSVNYTAPTP